MAEDIPNDPERPKRIQALAREASDDLTALQKQYASVAQQFGHASNELRALSSAMAGVPDSPFFANQEDTYKKFRIMVQAHRAPSDAVYGILTAATILTGTSTTAVSMSVTSQMDFKRFSQNLRSGADAQPWSKERTEHYANRLDKFRLGLGAMYLGAWEQFHSGATDGTRGAMTSMRELLSQFFEVLAPDDEVYASNVFKTKNGKAKPDQIYRRERIEYAAQKIADRAHRDLLLSQADDVLALFQDLHRLHAREEFEAFAMRELLKSGHGIIEQWINALDPDSGKFKLA